MKLAGYIARRYFFSRKSHGAINIISAISVAGVALATAALICTLSVFNGFSGLVADCFTAFDAELSITPSKGKVFTPSGPAFEKLRAIDEIQLLSPVLRDNAMIRYRDRQMVVTIKGVADNFRQLTPIDSIFYGAGTPRLHDQTFSYAIPGAGLVHKLNCGLRFTDPLYVYAPKRGAKINPANPASGFITDRLFSSGLTFAVGQQEYDENYIITSIDFARRIFKYKDEISSLSVKLEPTADLSQTKRKIQRLLGPAYKVEDRYEQQSDTFKVMKIEKLISYIFLTFILVIASFNIVGSLTMLIIEKKDDMVTLGEMGADKKFIRGIFINEGLIITICGALLGSILAAILCLAQERYGLISLGGGRGAGLPTDAYPIIIEPADILLTIATVAAVCAAAIRYTIRKTL